jgi:hypothetical protein
VRARCGETLSLIRFPGERMERLWSLAVAVSGNRWQMQRGRKRLRQAKTVATACDRLPPGPQGKEGVDGSSPSEGLTAGAGTSYAMSSDGPASHGVV